MGYSQIKETRQLYLLFSAISINCCDFYIKRYSIGYI